MAVATKRGFLRQAWELAWPYWRSEEKWSAIGTARAPSSRINLITVWLNVRFNYWNNDFYNALQQYDWHEFWRQFAIFGLIALALIVVERLFVLFAGNTAYPLAPLADRAVPAQLAREPILLPNAVRTRRRPTTRTSGSPKISTALPRSPRLVARAAERRRHPGLVLVDPVDPVRRTDDPARRRRVDQYSRLHGICGADLCGRRHDADPMDRLIRWSGSISISSATRLIFASAWSGCARMRKTSPFTAAKRASSTPSRPASRGSSRIGGGSSNAARS